ncbi:M20 family metallopeptidase [Deinococcus aquiradiocola]|uniref:Carboxypeptidase n=1 Tax=Deinococcus aquiradiocola TaxID=393059 RepID=A0A917PL44_9DEIO|nr:M20 family metallopeptidase [Deinococcus aquiradiocola]GGJ83168.1 carboxypeptidase [Deinococcus aquiradiocola]
MTATPTGPATPDAHAMLRDLRTLVEQESPSSDLNAVRAVQDTVQDWMQALGAQVETLPGDVRRFRFGPQDRPTLILMHADTVWPHGTLQDMPFQVDGDRAYGPGTYDMKGGIVMAVHALRALHGAWPDGGIEVLLTADEEVGSHLSRSAIEDAARHARRVLVVEPPVADTHDLKTARKGVGMFTVTVQGVAAHAGNRPQDGVNAILEAARLVLQAHDLARPDLGTTVSVGRVTGGGAVNVVPAHATFDTDLRVSTLQEAERLQAGFGALRAQDARATVTVTGGMNRPPFERTPGTAALAAQAQAHAARLGFTVGEASVGGGSDGNFTAPLSPTLDGLGAPGDGAHASHEHVRLDRWQAHTQLLTALLQEPGVQ